MSVSSSAAVSPDGYQVFLSYSRRDLGAVTAIAQKLKEQYKLSVWFDGDMRPGANWMTEISDAIVASATVAVFLGPGGVGDWQTPEMQRALDRATKGETRLIPVLLPGMSDNAVPELLRNYNYCAMQSIDQTALDRLYWGITGKNPLRERSEEHDAAAQAANVEQTPVAAAIESLAKRLASNNVTFILGRGAGRPRSNGDIAWNLFSELGMIKKEADADDLLPPSDVAASFFAIKHGEPELDYRIIDYISSRQIETPKPYVALARLQNVLGQRSPVRGRKLPKRLIISNNLDLQLERALVEQGVPFTRIVQFRPHYPEIAARAPNIQINAVKQVQKLADGRCQMIDTDDRIVGTVDPGDDAALGEAISGASTRMVTVQDGAMVAANGQPVSLGDLPEPVLYKLHGSQDVLKSCAISTEQYFCSLWRLIDQQCIPKEIGSIISLTPVVLMGSRILDADFRLSYTLLRVPLVAGNDERRWAVIPRSGGDERDGSYKFAKAAWKELSEVALERYSIRMLDEAEDVFFDRLTDAFLAQKRL